MSNKEINGNKQLVIRVMMMLLTILLSKNVEIEIVRPDITVKITTESISLQPITKLLEWF